MLKDKYYKRIVDNAPITFYLSANDGARVNLPGRMQPPHEISERYINACDSFIVDSAFNRPETDNQEVLDVADKLNADMAILEDVYQDFEGTVERVGEGLELAEEHSFDGRVIAPLQEPYVDCWKELGKPQSIAIGGLKSGSFEERKKAANQMRMALGKSGFVHGLGWGLTEEMILFIRKNPNVLDSIDARTPWSSARTNNEKWPKPESSHKSEICTIYSIDMLKIIMKKLRRTIIDYTLPPEKETKTETPEGYCTNPSINHNAICENCGKDHS